MIPKFNIKDMKLTKRWERVEKNRIIHEETMNKMEEDYDYESSPKVWQTGTSIPLGENETICPNCMGIGFDIKIYDSINPKQYDQCKSCHGYGKLDWCSKVTAGVKE